MDGSLSGVPGERGPAGPKGTRVSAKESLLCAYMLQLSQSGLPVLEIDPRHGRKWSEWLFLPSGFTQELQHGARRAVLLPSSQVG